MLLIKFLNNLFKKNGFILEDANGKEHVIGKPVSNNTIKMKIHDKQLHYKLLLYPDLYFGEAYTDGKITFKNGKEIYIDTHLKNATNLTINFKRQIKSMHESTLP